MVVGISMVKDEADIAPFTVRRMLAQVDRVIVADNNSTDGTRELLERIDDPRLCVLHDPEVGYFQSRKMTALAKLALELGAEWVVPFDADEAWHARTGDRVTDALKALPADVLVAQADLYDHVATAQDPAGLDPTLRIGWRRPDPAPLPKVACRALPGLTIAQGNHSATFDGTDHPLTVLGLLTVRHFPLRSVEQMIRKARNGAAAYAATDLPEDAGGHWRGWGRLDDAGIADVFRLYYWRAAPDQPLQVGGEQQPPLVYDPCPA
jgi:Glycosyl transferase family 2